MNVFSLKKWQSDWKNWDKKRFCEWLIQLRYGKFEKYAPCFEKLPGGQKIDIKALTNDYVLMAVCGVNGCKT